MKYRKEIDNDYAFGRGDAAFLVDNAQAVAQAVRTRLCLWRGQWFLDVNEGTPYAQAVLGKQAPDVYTLAIRDRISGTQGVKAITAFNTQNKNSNRRLTFSVTLDTIYGEVTVDV
ncbi:hypothetical protein [Dryocola sp. BD586]|jgi:hypothetical protein|uniref:hypothetical protein n=1 Tax=Dryocola sp. BD586 TaxID=3133271 RepID=UPI003F506F91